MLFKVYSGRPSTNCSVDITFRGSFEAETIKEAVEIIEWNKERRNSSAWQVPKKDNNGKNTKYVEALHSNFCYALFVCKEDMPTSWNLIWDDKKGGHSFFKKTA